MSGSLETQGGSGIARSARGAGREEWSGGDAGCIIYQVLIHVSVLCWFHSDITWMKRRQKSATKQHNGGKDLQHSVVEPCEVWQIKQTPWSTLTLALSLQPARAFRQGSRMEQETAKESGKNCGATA